MKRIVAILSVITIIFMSLFSVSCGKPDNGPDDGPDNEPDMEVRIYTLKGPTGMGMAKLMEDCESGAAPEGYRFTVVSAPTEITPEVIGGRFEIAAVPVNLAATLVNKGADISVVAVNTLGVLYLVENGNAVTDIKSLKGKTVYSTGKGSTPEYIFNYLLEKNGLSANDVEVIFMSDGSEVASNLAAGKIEIGLIPEPNVTAALNADKDGKLRIALNITEEWDRVCDTGLIQGVIIASNDYINNHRNSFNTFMSLYSDSVKYTSEHRDEASVLIEKFGIIPKAAVAKKALPNCNICCITGNEAKLMIQNMLTVLFEANSGSVGGKLPEDGFYYVG